MTFAYEREAVVDGERVLQGYASVLEPSAGPPHPLRVVQEASGHFGSSQGALNSAAHVALAPTPHRRHARRRVLSVLLFPMALFISCFPQGMCLANCTASSTKVRPFRWR